MVGCGIEVELVGLICGALTQKNHLYQKTKNQEYVFQHSNFIMYNMIHTEIKKLVLAQIVVTKLFFHLSHMNQTCLKEMYIYNEIGID